MGFERIEIDGIDYFYRELYVTQDTINMWRMENRQDNTTMPVCKLCHKEINEPQKLYLIINNYKAFPNCWVHKGCFERRSIITIMCTIKNDYTEGSKYEHWFR